MSYGPRWRLARWYPAVFAVEVEGEPGFVGIEPLDPAHDLHDVADTNNGLWEDVSDELDDLGIEVIPDPELCEEDWCYPEDAYERLAWREFADAPPHVRAAILARRVEMLEAEITVGTPLGGQMDRTMSEMKHYQTDWSAIVAQTPNRRFAVLRETGGDEGSDFVLFGPEIGRYANFEEAFRAAEGGLPGACTVCGKPVCSWGCLHAHYVGAEPGGLCEGEGGTEETFGRKSAGSGDPRTAR